MSVYPSLLQPELSEGSSIDGLIKSYRLVAMIERYCIDSWSMWDDSFTEDDNILKQDGLCCIRELAEHETITKQERKSGNHVFNWFCLQLLAWACNLSSHNDGLCPGSVNQTSLFIN